MSRGHGKIERQILAIIDGFLDETFALPGISTQKIADKIAEARHQTATPALDASVRRAVASLKREGLIWSIARDRSGKYWLRRRQSTETLTRTLPTHDRERLSKLLGMLGSDHAGERENAASLIEQERKRLGLSWKEILSVE